MAEINLNYYKNEKDGLYSDGPEERFLAERIAAGNLVATTSDSWPVFYHLSDLRENLLNWYDFAPESTALEIGAGCGALTGLLAERMSRVVACELTMPRAEIIRKRYEKSENIEIIVGDINDINLQEKFDYVTLIGVLEYAGTICKGKDDPYEQLLNKASSFLKPGGKLLVAIENRFGLKYFAGAREDHLGRSFVGINGYKDSRVKTFNRKELESLVEKAGLKISKRYYPYPDYKFPTEIFTDTSINSRIPLTSYYPFDQEKANLFDEYNVWSDFAGLGIMQEFSNSFLFELTLDENNEADLKNKYDYIKISACRKKSLSVITKILANDKKVYKTPVYRIGEEHIRNISGTDWEKGFLHNQMSVFQGGAMVSDYITQPNLQFLISKLLAKGEKETAIKFFETLKDQLYAGIEKKYQLVGELFNKVFGHCVSGWKFRWLESANIDIVPANIFPQSTCWEIIDCEWTFDFPIPAEYVLWRSIWHCPPSATPFGDRGSEDELAFVEITREEEEIFKQWEKSFAWDYVGAYALPNKPVNLVSLDDLILTSKSKVSLENEIVEARDYISGLLSELEKKRLESDDMLLKIKQQGREINENNATISALSASLEEKERAMIQTGDAVKKITEELNRKNNEIASLRSKMDGIRKEVRDLTRQRDIYSEMFSQLTEKE